MNAAGYLSLLAPRRCGMHSLPRRVAALLLAGAAHASGAANAADCHQQLALQPGVLREVTVPSARFLIEEIGTDVEYRWHAADTFRPVATPPDRLGFAVLQAPGAATLTLRVRSGQGGGQVRLDGCIDAGEAAFYDGLAQLQQRHLESGRERALLALPALQYLRRWPLDAQAAAWVGSAYANVLTSAGDNSAAEQAFLETRQYWLQAGRPERAAIALMAAGDSASRGGRYADAQRQLGDAAATLHEQGIAYYALRSESALCMVLSRQHRYQAAVACEQQAIADWTAQQELREAALREISLGNLWISLRDAERAQPHFIAARGAEALLSPIVRSRLESSIGGYLVSRGDLPGAAQSFARAAQLLGGSGLPAEQSNLDLKLAGLAQLAGAIPEQVRLLEAAIARLPVTQDPQHTAVAQLRLAESLLSSGDTAKSLAAADAAASLCRKLEDRTCADQAHLVTARILLQQQHGTPARAQLAATRIGNAHDEARKATLAAWADLLDGKTQAAWAQLQAIDASLLSPEAQIELAQRGAETLQQLGRTPEALQLLAQLITEQANQAAHWPSAALRLSARNRLATLQAAYFDIVLSDQAGPSAIAERWPGLLEVLHAAAIQQLFAHRASAQLPESLRAALSAAIDGAAAPEQRGLFVALADAAPVAPAPASASASAAASAVPVATAAAAAPIGTALDIDDLVLLPLAGEMHFHLLAWQAGQTRRCLQLPIADYATLVRRYDAALDGADDELPALQQEAERWHRLIRRCSAAAPSARRWHVVASAGTPAMPWTWIAAAAADEPTLTTTLVFPAARAQPAARPQRLLLLDLDMPHVAPLPLASREIAALETLALQAGIATQRLRAAEMPAEALLQELAAAPAVHLVGHANPAAFGQLYQGLWYEAERKPMLLTYPEIAALQSRAELVVLSACGTRASDQQRYGAAARLAEALIAAGARHVVAASNPLSDAAAPVWTRAFYSALWRDGDAAAAAREARALLRASPHFRHPKFWAGIDYYAAVPADSGAEAAVLP